LIDARGAGAAGRILRVTPAGREGLRDALGVTLP
jgi:hypothetical protein